MTDLPRDLAAAVERIKAHQEKYRPLFDPDDSRVAYDFFKNVDTLLLHIAALSRELEELRRPVTAENYGPTLASDINALPDRLRRYVHDLETRADPSWDVRRAYVAEENAVALNNRVEELEADLTALRRPVVQSEKLEADRCFVNDKSEPDIDGVWWAMSEFRRIAKSAFEALDTTARQLRERVEMLEAAQRENEGLQTAVVQLEEVCRLYQQQVARLSSPPQERAEIAARLKNRLEVFPGCHPGSAIDDVRTLLGDSAAWRNALAVSRAKCERLEQQQVTIQGAHDHALQTMQRAEISHGQRIERLEGAVRKVVDWNAKYPSSRIYNELDIRIIAAEMDQINAECTLVLECQQRQRFEPQVLSGCAVRAEMQREALAAGDGRQPKCARCADTGRRWDAGGDITECECRYSATGDGVEGPIPGIDQGQFLAACGGVAAVLESNNHTPGSGSGDAS